MVGFNQSAYVFDEDASTGQVCITYTGELAPTVSLSLGLLLVEESADGTFFNSLPTIRNSLKKQKPCTKV